MKAAMKASLLSVLQLVQCVAPLPLLRVKPIYLAGQSSAKENSAHCRQVRLDRAAYDVCPMRAKENQTHSAALSGYDDSPRISVLPGSAELSTNIH